MSWKAGRKAAPTPLWKVMGRLLREHRTPVAVAVLMAGGSGSLYLRYRDVMKLERRRLMEGVFVRNSLELLRGDEKAVYLLGRPIWNKNIDYRDSTNTFTTPTEAGIMVPVTGPQGSGNYHLRASPDEEGFWRARRCDLEVTSCTVLEEEKWRNKRLIVFDRERHGDLVSVNDTDEVLK